MHVIPLHLAGLAAHREEILNSRRFAAELISYCFLNNQIINEMNDILLNVQQAICIAKQSYFQVTTRENHLNIYQQSSRDL